MSTNNTFAYNSGGGITGTTQVGTIAVGTPTVGFVATGKSWRLGPDEDLGYVIAYTASPPRTAGGGTEVIAVNDIAYKRSAAKTEASFIALANKIGNQTFATGDAATTWLNANGYWTSWVTPYTAGLYKTTYTGYFADVVSFFATATPQAFGANPATSVQTTSIFEPSSDDGSNFSCQWLGYFKPTTTQTYTFYTSSDDASYMWIGTNAQSGFTTANATVNNGGAHGPTETSGTASLTAGVYYPIRIQFGEAGGGDVMTFNYSTPTITKTTNVTGLVFYNTTTNNF